MIFAHFFMCDGFTHELRMTIRLYEVSIVCISLFFAISGYLIHPSLERAPSLKEFYKKKLVRLVVPFTVSYIVMAAGMSALSIFNEHLTDKVPMYHAAFGARYLMVFLGMFPVDLNITKFIGWEVEWFIGEWFMGIILIMFLISPFLDKCALKAPVLSFAASIGIAFVVFYATEDMTLEGQIHSNTTLVLVRVPEFYFGMLLFIYREKFLRIRRWLVPVLLVYLAAQIAYFVNTYPLIGAIFFPKDPACYATTLPIIYLFFTLAEWLNEHSSKVLDWFNSFNGISYIVLLTQHMVIYAFSEAIDFGRLHSFGMIYMLLLITWVILLISWRIQKISDPIEKYFLKKGAS